MSLTSGTHLGPYEILAPLGAGGMGEVYRAKDGRLGREVAVKVLPERMAQDSQALSRFEREAKAVAALPHPNILAVYDVGRERGVSYVVTELLEGETLRQRVRGSPIPWRKAVEYGIAVTDGLAAAHAKGIIHRDVKPENIFLTSDGVVKILDFGLAHVEPTSDSPNQADMPTMTLDTKPGTVLGTVNYMSPEQVRGLKTDARSDIFSFGCVLYEMVSGRRAFSGDTSADTMTAILKEEPESIAQSLSDVGPELGRVIGRCLEKKPAQRIQSARDLGFALRDILIDSGVSKPTAAYPPSRSRKTLGITIGAVVLIVAAFLYFQGERPQQSAQRGKILSLAVLPFENLSGRADQEYFVDAMTDAIIGDLAKISALRVISRTSIMQYKNTRKRLPEIARELNVDALVEGSIVLAGDHVQIRARLIEASTERQVWAERYQRDRRDILAIYSDVARAIAEGIQIELTPAEAALLASAPKVNPDAYDAYARGLELVIQGTQEACQEALTLFDQALGIDPEFALAHVGRARAYDRLSSTHMHPRETLPAMRQAAQQALMLDEGLAEAHVAMGNYRMQHDWDWKGAKESYQRALQLNPNLSDARLAYALYLVSMKRPEEGMAQLNMVRELDPAARHTNDDFGGVSFMARRFERTVSDSRAALKVNPKFYPAHEWMGLALAQLGKFAEGISHLREALQLSESPQIAAELGGVLAVAGYHEEARSIRKRVKEHRDVKYVCPYEVATISIGLNEYDEAFEDMHEACDDRAACIPWLQADPRLDPIRDDPRFDDLLERVGFEPQHRQLRLADPGRGDKPTLAVLPLKDRSSDRTDWFADSLTEELIGTLAKIKGLSVISQQSVMRFKDSSDGLPAIARKLGADYIVEGSTLRANDRIRINVNLVDGRSDKHLWSDRYESDSTDILNLQNEVALAVAKQIEITLTPQDRVQLSGAPRVNVAAYEAYLRGKEYLRRHKAEDVLKALEWFDKATEIDPDFALAYVGKSQANLFLAGDHGAPHELMPKAKTAALRAIELDDRLAEAYAALGEVQLEYDWKWDKAVVSFRHALELRPGLSEAHLGLARYFTIMNDAKEAEKHLSFAKESDPYSIASSEQYALTYYLTRQYDKVVEHCREAIEMDRNQYLAHQWLGLALVKLGKIEEAISEAAEALRLYPNPVTLADLGSVYAAAGYADEAQQILRELDDMRNERYVCAYRSAVIHSELDESEAAFDMLGRACTDRSECMPFINVDPRLDRLRGDIRFSSYVECVGLELEPLPIALNETPNRKIMLAVVPFENVSSDPDTEYLSNEIPASIIGRLSRLSGLSVIPRSSAFRFDVTREDASSFAKRLSASVVLTGQLNARGTSLTIRAELIDVANNRELWSERYNRNLTDIVAVEAEITQSISQSLSIQLSPKEQTRLAKAKMVNPDAHRFYLQGRFWWNKFTAADYRKALFYFEQAIEKDPTYASAYAELANTYILMGGWYGDMPPREAFPKAKEAAIKALEIDPALAEAHRSLAFSLFVYEWDWQGAEQEFMRAIRLNPDSATAHGQYGVLLHVMGRLDQAKKERKRAVELDPLSPILHTALGEGHARVGEYEQAVKRFTEALRLDPGFPPAFAGLGFTYLSERKYEDAIAAFREAALGSRNASFLGWLGLAYTLAGKRTEALATLDELEQASTTGHGRVPAALVHAALGNVERAFELLEIAYDERESELVWINTLLPFDSLRDDPRFNDLVRRLGQEPEPGS